MFFLRVSSGAQACPRSPHTHALVGCSCSQLDTSRKPMPVLGHLTLQQDSRRLRRLMQLHSSHDHCHISFQELHVLVHTYKYCYGNLCQHTSTVTCFADKNFLSSNLQTTIHQPSTLHFFTKSNNHKNYLTIFNHFNT